MQIFQILIESGINLRDFLWHLVHLRNTGRRNTKITAATFTADRRHFTNRPQTVSEIDRNLHPKQTRNINLRR